MRVTSSATRVWWAAATAAVGASMVLAGCSSGSKAGGVTSGESAQQTVQTAVSKLGSGTDLKMVVSLPISASQAEQLSTQGGGKGITQQEANALTSGKIFLNVATGRGEALDSTQALTDPQDSLDLGVTIGGNTPVELVYVGQNLYAKADLHQLLSDIGQDPTKASLVTNGLSSLNNYVGGLSALAAGNWVEIDHNGLESLAPLLKQVEASSGSSIDPAKVGSDLMTLRSQLIDALKTNSAYANPSNGHYSVTVDVHGFLTTIKPEIQNALADIPQLGTVVSNALAKATSQVPA